MTWASWVGGLDRPALRSPQPKTPYPAAKGILYREPRRLRSLEVRPTFSQCVRLSTPEVPCFRL
jgi:hypothetical protein